VRFHNALFCIGQLKTPSARTVRRSADIAHARFLAQPRNSFSSAHVPVVGHGQIVMPGPASDTAAQHLTRARYVPERTVNRGDPQSLTGRPEQHRPAKAQVSGAAPEAVKAGHAGAITVARCCASSAVQPGNSLPLPMTVCLRS